MLGVVLRAFKTLKRVIDVCNIQLGCFESYANNKKTRSWEEEMYFLSLEMRLHIHFVYNNTKSLLLSKRNSNIGNSVSFC